MSRKSGNRFSDNDMHESKDENGRIAAAISIYLSKFPDKRLF
ncbi:hypothetical protein Brsp05_02691 [Brucella sp. NBRC 12953]